MYPGRTGVLLCACTLFLGSAQAVVVRGKVTSPLGVPQPGARVQLILGPRSVADTIAGADGAYEIRSSARGRFVLLTSSSVASRSPAVQVSPFFYGGRTDEVRIDIALDPARLTPQTSDQLTQRMTPLAQLASRTTQIAADQLLTREDLVAELPQTTVSAVVVRSGQTGAPAALLLRGADASATKLIIDGISAEALGGGFNLGALGALGLAAVAATPAVEITSGASPLDTADAEAGVLSLHTAPATAARFRLLYSGDAGTLDTVRNEAMASYTRSRLDLLAGFTRFDTANASPAARSHLATAAADLGFHLSANSSLRLTLRDDVGASALPNAYDFFLLQPEGRLAEQNLVAGFTYDMRTHRDWHTLARYGMVRERQQTLNYVTPATGLPVTILGANGASATGVATFNPLPSREDRVSNRDEYTIETDAPIAPWLAALLLVRYQDERAADILPATVQATFPTTRVERTHLAFAGGLNGNLRRRVFYETSGLLDFGNSVGSQNTLGLHGEPRVGLSWAPVRPGRRRLSGTTLHLTAATGFREPSLAEQVAFPLSRTTPRSRTFSAGADQNLLHEKLTVSVGYFHNQFAHQTELLQPETSSAPARLAGELAYRSQGFELAARYTPVPRILVQGGYTYLASMVERSSARAVINPAFPGVDIGQTTALTGSRPFDRPPGSGFLAAQFTGKTIVAALQADSASRSDDTTALTRDPRLLLPNRNLSPGYLSLDASLNVRVNRRLTVYTQLDNLTDNRHIAPIGCRSTPFLLRAGLRIRLGGE